MLNGSAYAHFEKNNRHTGIRKNTCGAKNELYSRPSHLLDLWQTKEDKKKKCCSIKENLLFFKYDGPRLSNCMFKIGLNTQNVGVENELRKCDYKNYMRRKKLKEKIDFQS